MGPSDCKKKKNCKKHVTQEFCKVGYPSNATNLFLIPNLQLWDRATVTGKWQKVAAYQPLGPKVYNRRGCAQRV